MARTLDGAGAQRPRDLVLLAVTLAACAGPPAAGPASALYSQSAEPANVGDQLSDLEGGYSERGFLLPNPFYRIP